MSEKLYPVKSYKVILGSKLSDQGIRYHAGISFTSAELRMGIFFTPEDSEQHVTRVENQDSLVILYMYAPISEYGWYVDLLRNEGPITIAVDREDPKRCRLFTEDEPVAENE